jgi:PIN domain nuclease of toxin-antitoxin system
MKALLDTHILLWWLNHNSRLSREQLRIIRTAREDRPLWVSDITLWEIANLTRFGRLRLHLPLREFLERAVASPLVQCLRITAAVAAEVASLPEAAPRDPADRIIVASARVLGASLLTQDMRLIESGLVPTVE